MGYISFSITELLRLYCAPDIFSGHNGSFFICLRKDNGKLLAAISGCYVDTPDTLADSGGTPPQDLIPLGVAVFVVIFFEVVHIEYQDGYRRIGPCGPVGLELQPVIKMPLAI